MRSILQHIAGALLFFAGVEVVWYSQGGGTSNLYAAGANIALAVCADAWAGRLA